MEDLQSTQSTNVDYLVPDFMRTPEWSRLAEAFSGIKEKLVQACLEHDITEEYIDNITCISSANRHNRWCFIIGDILLSTVETPIEDSYHGYSCQEIAQAIIIPIRYDLRKSLK